MPYPSEHAARVRNPGDFQDNSFRRKTIDDGVDLIMGKLKGKDALTAQAYRFNADKFTASEAKDWCKRHDVEYISFEESPKAEDMKSATFKLYDEINDEGIDAKILSDFIDQNKDAEELVIRINSIGGDVQEGWAMHDLLINSGKKIRTVGEGKIYSIATIVFLAGEEREVMKNADGLIHNPFIPPYTLADAYESGDLIKLAEGLIQEEQKILDYYIKRTGTSQEKLAEYMKEDTKLSAEDLLSLGFATKIIEPVKAVAYYKPINNLNMTEKDVKTWGQKLDKAISRLEKVVGISRVEPDNMVLKDKDGNEFTIEKESGAPVVGDKASPDGTFVMDDGKTIVISGGAVTEINEPELEGKDKELADAKAKIAELEQEIADMKAGKDDLEKAQGELKTGQEELEAKKKETEEQLAEVQAVAKELKSLKNEWKPDGRTRVSALDKVGNIDLTQVREILKNKKETENTK